MAMAMASLPQSACLSTLNSPSLSWICNQVIDPLLTTTPLLTTNPNTKIFALTLTALALPLLYFAIRSLHHHFTMENTPTQPFPFMDLPPELREMVYGYCLQDPYYGPRSSGTQNSSSSSVFSWLIPNSNRSDKKPACANSTSKESTWIFLASRQVYAECIDLFFKQRTVHLALTPENYVPPTRSLEASISTSSFSSSAPSSISWPSSPASKPEDTNNELSPSTTTKQPIWPLPPTFHPQIKSLTLSLTATSTLLGVANPHDMPPTSWTLAHRIRSELSSIPSSTPLTLSIKAISTPLWNPLWVWFHASQSFKEGPGPRLQTVVFLFDGWATGENRIERDKNGEWNWVCTQGHVIGKEEGEKGVRAFCIGLYLECKVCKPDVGEESDEEDEE